MNKTAITILLSASVLLSGCASNPDKMQTSYVSTIKYNAYTCGQLQMEYENTDRRVGVLYNALKKEANADNWQMGIGLLVFWPALIFIEGGDGPEAAEYSRLKGELVALEKSMVEHTCPRR